MKPLISGNLAGFTHAPWNAQRILLSGKMFKAELIREPENQYDANAIRVEVSGTKVGYVPRGKARMMPVPGITSKTPLLGTVPGEKNVALAQYLDAGTQFSAWVQWPMQWRNDKDQTCRRTTFKPTFLPDLYIFEAGYTPTNGVEFNPISDDELKIATQFLDFGAIGYYERHDDSLWLGKLFYVVRAKKFAVWGGVQNELSTYNTAIDVINFSTDDYLPFHIIEEADINFDNLSIRVPDSYSDKIKVENALVATIKQIKGNHSGKYKSFYS